MSRTVPGTVPSPTGPTGPAGPTGPPAGALTTTKHLTPLSLYVQCRIEISAVVRRSKGTVACRRAIRPHRSIHPTIYFAHPSFPPGRSTASCGLSPPTGARSSANRSMTLLTVSSPPPSPPPPADRSGACGRQGRAGVCACARRALAVGRQHEAQWRAGGDPNCEYTTVSS